MRFCHRLQLDRTRRILRKRQSRIEENQARRVRKRMPVVITPARQLEIAMKALDTQEALGQNGTAA